MFICFAVDSSIAHEHARPVCDRHEHTRACSQGKILASNIILVLKCSHVLGSLLTDNRTYLMSLQFATSSNMRRAKDRANMRNE